MPKPYPVIAGSWDETYARVRSEEPPSSGRSTFSSSTIALTVARAWRYVYRAVDKWGQVIDVYVSLRRSIAAAR